MASGSDQKAVGRRPSASSAGTPAAATGTNSSTRMHRSNDSHHGFVGIHPTNPAQGSFSSTAFQNSFQSKAVLALIKRITSKLPCYSGISLADLESDDAVLNILQTLMSLTDHSLDIIVWKLSEELERIAKAETPVGHQPLEVLQSEVFLLKVMSMILSCQWQDSRIQQKALHLPGIDGSCMESEERGSASPVPAAVVSDFGRDDSGVSSPAESLEATSLDVQCARYVILVMVLLFRHSAPNDDRTKAYDNLSSDVSIYDFEIVNSEDALRNEQSAPWLHESNNGLESYYRNGIFCRSHSAPSLASKSSTASTPNPSARASLGFVKTPRTLIGSVYSLYSLITDCVGHVVHLLSVSNWSVVLEKIRNKIYQLALTPEDSDYTDLQLLQYCSLDRNRLQVILQELSSLLINMKSEAQCAIAVYLRKAIWKWIEVFPSEYFELSTGKRKFEGAAERVFDILYSTESEHNRKILWPVLTSLLLLSYDRLVQIAMSYDGQSWNPKASSKKDFTFVDKLFKNLSANSRLSETAILCLSDILRAAMFIPPIYDVALRSFAPDIAFELKNRLWKAQNQRPFFESSESIDVTLHSDALHGIVRFLPEDEYTNLIFECFEPERSDAIKLTAVKTLIAMCVTESHWPHLTHLLNTDRVRIRIKKILQSIFSRNNEANSGGMIRGYSSKPTLKRYSPEIISEKELLLLGIFCLCRYDIRFYPKFRGAVEVQQWSNQVYHSMKRPEHPAVPISCLRALVHRTNLALHTGMENPEHEDCKVWRSVNLPIHVQSAASYLLDCGNNLIEQRIFMEMVYNYCKAYKFCIMSELPVNWDFSNNRLPAVVLAEIACLVTLTSADTTISALACRTLREIAIAECLPFPNRSVEEPDERATHYPIYEQLGDPSVVVVGRVAQQKRMRKLLRLLTNPCPVRAAVWYECYWRWVELKDRILRPPSFEQPSFDLSTCKHADESGMTTEERFHQWQNLTWFLASFGAVSIDQESTESLKNLNVLQAMPERFRAPLDRSNMLDHFMSTTVDALISDTAVARDTAKEAMGSELNPLWFAKLFRQLHDVIEDLVRTASNRIPSPDEEELLHVFFDQFLTVIKLLVDRLDAPLDEALMNEDLSQALLTLGKFMDRFVDVPLLRLRIKFCTICELIAARSNSFGISRDERARNSLLNVLGEWLESEEVERDEFGLMRLKHESNVAALRAVVRLLERLRLQSMDNAPGDDAAHVMSRRFLRYQTILLRGLHMDPFEPAHGDEDKSSQHSRANRRKTQQDKDTGLQNLIISGLAQLLSANTDIGLKHFLPLGYDNDARKRIIFCRVITRVMNLGGRLETHNDRMITGHRSKIGELVKGCDMALVLAICENCPPSEVDAVNPVLLNLFDTRSSLLELLKLLIEREVKTTTSETELFRGNSMRVKFLCAFARIHGYDYLRKLLKQLLDKMLVYTTQSFILDPSKAPEREIADNQQAIKVLAGVFLVLVCTSAASMPLMLREVCAHISHTVAEVWPESKFTALGAFLFLRFISPALVSPETIDLEIPEDRQNIKRGLLIIAKVIQNLANNVRFGKEVHMMCFNDFLQDHIFKVMKFLAEVNKPIPLEEELDEWRAGNFDETDAIVLHRFFERHADRVGRDLLSLVKPDKDKGNDSCLAGGKKAWDNLCAALVDMGQPVEVPRLSPLSSSNFLAYREFMAHNADRSVSSVQELFFNAGCKKDDTLIFLLMICKFDIEVLDYELMEYHILRTLSESDPNDYEIVVDCTNYTTASEVPLQWFKIFLELLPCDIRARFRAAYILNCNLAMQRYLRKLYNICASTFYVDVKYKASVTELCESLGCDISRALSSTTTLEAEERDIFNGVMLRQGQNVVKVAATLAVGKTHLRIDSIKLQNVYANFSCRTTEIVPFTDIGDIYNISTGRDANEFIIRRQRNGGTLYFSTSERDLIVKTIRTAKSRMNVTRSNLFDRFSRLFNVSAALLNISMFNISNSNVDVRFAAYDLLAAVCQSINFDASSLLPSAGGFIADRPSTITYQLSEKLSAFVPELTLDFISQICLEMDKSSFTQKSICLNYMTPWIRNFSNYCNPTNKLYDASGARVRDCIRLLLDLAVRDAEACHIMMTITWTELGKLDSTVINVVLDEIMRAAVDGGLGSARCEIMADIISSMSSRSSRGRVLAKLRKALSKTSARPSKTLDKNIHWNEITVYSRLALGTGQLDQHCLQIQQLVPEAVHLITLLACQGDSLMRNTVHGLALQLIQSIYMMHQDESTLSSEIRSLLLEFSLPQTMRLFGLAQSATASELIVIHGADDKATLEGLSRWLLRAITICAGNPGLANIWRARWMGLLTATAFQLSQSIQPRAFVIMGTLASSDVDDDLLYQMLVALKNAIKNIENTDMQSVVCMLTCVCNSVPSLPEGSRYIGTLFWLAVALLQSSHAPFFEEANHLLCACITTLNNQCAFHGRGFSETLLEARSSLEEVTFQMDHFLGLSFERNFSLSLAPVIFKGIRRPQLRESAINTLRCLLTTLASTLPQAESDDEPIHMELLGYFLALLSVSTTMQSYQQLLIDARVGTSWRNGRSRFGEKRGQLEVPFEILGCNDHNTALLAISFLACNLSTAQTDEPECQMLFTLLKNASRIYPDTISLVYDSVQDKVHDIFTSSSNSSILSSASVLFKIAMEDYVHIASPRDSTSTLGTLVEDKTRAHKHVRALEQLTMQGLADAFLFLPLNHGRSSKILLQWIPALVSKIIE